jgi:hypothetical protein
MGINTGRTNHPKPQNIGNNVGTAVTGVTTAGGLGLAFGFGLR